MSSYDQSLALIRADERARFYESSANRWRAAFDALMAALDETDPLTAQVLEDAERARQAIPLKYEPARIDT